MQNPIGEVMQFPALQVQLPEWLASALPGEKHVYASDEERMALVVDLAARNVAESTGGPFGAAIFDRDSGRLIAPGVNIVVPAQWSGGHAEIVAFSIAQQKLRTHDLGAPGMPRCELFASTEPCAMCLGATPWSGVSRVVCAARDEDARAVGFDEGAKPEHWVDALECRGIEVRLGLLRDRAVQVLRDYVEAGGPVYNGRGAGSGAC